MMRAARSRSPINRRAAVDALIDAVAASGALISGGARDDVLADAAASIREPVTWYLEHVHWPSYLTAHGIPLELSVAIDERGHASFRYATDRADHRSWLAGNWSRYRDAAVEITGAPVMTIGKLLTDHLGINPPTLRSPVYHGVGYASGRRRSSIYFFIGGLSRNDFERRFRRQAAAIDKTLTRDGGRRPDRYHGVAYDFDERAAIYRTKFYAWVDLEKPLVDLREVLGTGHDLGTAQALMSHLRQRVQPSRNARCTLLQSSLSGHPLRCRHKLFLHCDAWRLNHPDALLEVIKFLSSRTKIDLSPLYGMLSVFGASEIPLLPVWVAVGPGDSAASLTFYFAPMLERAVAATSVTSAGVERMCRRGVDYLLARRGRDGSWSDGDRGCPPEILTPRIAVALSGRRQSPKDLRATRRWLAHRSSDATVIRHAREAALQSQLALHRLGFETATTKVVRGTSESPELAGLELLLSVETGPARKPRVDRILGALRRRERWSGGWSGGMDDLTVTTRVVEGLAAVADSAAPGRALAAQMLKRAAYVYSERPVPSEPAQIALWLKGRTLCGRDPAHPSVARALAHLSLLQQRDGRWLATPFETSSGEHADLDASGLATTALVVEALDMLLDRTARLEISQGETAARPSPRARR